MAFFIPYRQKAGEAKTQLERMEEVLHPVVVFCILPLFAFANTGISLSLFISSLSFEQDGANFIGDRLGILLGSVLSGIWGYLVLRFATAKNEPT